jgi:hypothetical protein
MPDFFTLLSSAALFESKRLLIEVGFFRQFASDFFTV